MKYEDFIPRKTQILYRGQQYKIQEKKKEKINGETIIMLKIPHKKYDMWVNANYVILC